MQILNWIPSHAHQIRYVAPYYEEDSQGDRYMVNDDEATNVWQSIILQVHKTKRPMYYRRRTIDMSRRDRVQHQCSIVTENDWANDWAKCIYVRAKVIGRRVLFIYDEEFMHKIWITNKNRKKLKDKIRELKEKKFKNYSKKILKDAIPTQKDEFIKWLDTEIPEMTHELIELGRENDDN
jgi:hypothetical protein